MICLLILFIIGKHLIHELIQNAPKDWEILMLGYFSLNPEFKDSYRLWNNDWSALSYIVNKNALTKLNSIIDQNNKFKLLDDVNVADNYILDYLKHMFINILILQ